MTLSFRPAGYHALSFSLIVFVPVLKDETQKHYPAISPPRSASMSCPVLGLKWSWHLSIRETAARRVFVAQGLRVETIVMKAQSILHTIESNRPILRQTAVLATPMSPLGGRGELVWLGVRKAEFHL